MPIPNPNPESSTTRPESNQSILSQEVISLIEGTSEREHDIISDGDLVLIVGADEKRIRITVQAARVCSHILGQILDQHNIIDADNTGRVRELRLPDDSPIATRNAFGSIYPGNPHTDDLLPAEIYGVVVFARKYKMIPEFKKVALNWFRPILWSHCFHLLRGLEECWHLMMAAHYMLLDDPNALPELHFGFSKLSERLMLTVLKSISTARFVRPGGGMQRKWYSVVAWEALYHAPEQDSYGVMEASACVRT
ncbi:hypothetical protein FMEXI_9659 [Fusarium mexicanum]|uniref:BTB domain-containing protein n=1 Tax=Fusarium mexicanum TaxID=751941 RepID=A0A8H5IKY6_9HYPO|nr:hypothetical protein FMEXI_9659 [Fusarium mexicanum]